MEYEEDNDDILFAKWMSSFWGHRGIEEGERDARNHRKRQSRALSERRASLPCPSQLSAMHVTRFHSASKAPSPVYLKGFKDIREDTKCNNHMKMSKISLVDNSLPESKGQKKRSNSIQEFSESFEKQLRFRTKRSTSLGEHSVSRRNSGCREKNEDEDPCVICHDDLHSGSVWELHCMHRFHKECIEKWLCKKQTCPTCRVQVFTSKSFFLSSARMKVP
ncbi:leukemia NUP98 fusion partner 1 [Spea bombifrons]|uniref:leukemia NUP98 fusion partner 1 n=1 Tax=Spea bombifrons TaxID=233779 RepID=UPI00234A677C|nr:leukemia NUP98 fusion partner 1 [Spea bombifrons]